MSTKAGVFVGLFGGPSLHEIEHQSIIIVVAHPVFWCVRRLPQILDRAERQLQSIGVGNWNSLDDIAWELVQNWWDFMFQPRFCGICSIALGATGTPLLLAGFSRKPVGVL